MSDLTDQILSCTIVRAKTEVNLLENAEVGTYTILPTTKGGMWILKIDEVIRYNMMERRYEGFYVSDLLSGILSYCVLKDIDPVRI